MAPRKKKSNQVTLFDGGSTLVIKPPTQEEISQALAQAKAAVQEIHAQVEALIVTNQKSYSEADRLLSDVMAGDRVIEEKFSPVVRLLREPLDVIYELRREVAVPLAADKLEVKRKMGVYQLEEKKRLDAEAEENRRKAQELVEWMKQEPTLPTGMGIASTQTGVPQVTFLAPPPQPAPSAAHSSARFVKKWRITNLELLIDMALVGELPLDILTINTGKMEDYFQAEPERVGSWPGVEVYDHAVITGR